MPPTPALLLAVRVLALALPPVVLAWLVSGPLGALAAMLGIVAAAPAALAPVRRRDAVALAALAVAAGPVGLAIMEHPWLTATAVAASVLLALPLTLRYPGAAVMLPVLVTVYGSSGVPDQPWTVTVWGAVGCATAVVVVRIVGVSAPLPPVPRDVAVRHAVVTAVAAGPAVWLLRSLEISHAHWLVAALVLVLLPEAGATWRAAGQRWAGTVAGIVVAVAVVLLAPYPVVLLAAAGTLVGLVAWAVAADRRWTAAYASALVVLVGSSGLAGQGVDLALDRVLLTAGGIALGLVAAAALLKVGTRSG